MLLMERSACPDPSDKRHPTRLDFCSCVRVTNLYSHLNFVSICFQGCCCHRKEQFQGIELEVCRQLASKGVMVILTARNEKKGSEVDMLHGSGLPDVQFHLLDVSDPTDAARLAEFIREKFGRLDILVSFF